MLRKKIIPSLLCLLLLSACSAPPTSDSGGSAVLSESTSGVRSSVAEETKAPQPSSNAAVEQATVLRAVDGDTLEIRLDGQKERVRLIGVDTPETHHPSKPVQYFGPEAAAYTAQVLTAGRTVWLQKDKTDRDRYGRLLRYLWLTAPSSASPSNDEIAAQMFNAQLVIGGYAVPKAYAPDLRYVGLFTDLSQAPRSEGRGVWGAPAGAPSNLPDRQFQQKKTAPPQASAGEQAVHGNRRSKIYHLPGQQGYDKISERNIVIFQSAAEAEAAGYRAAQR